MNAQHYRFLPTKLLVSSVEEVSLSADKIEKRTGSWFLSERFDIIKWQRNTLETHIFTSASSWHVIIGSISKFTCSPDMLENFRSYPCSRKSSTGSTRGDLDSGAGMPQSRYR